MFWQMRARQMQTGIVSVLMHGLKALLKFMEHCSSVCVPAVP